MYGVRSLVIVSVFAAAFVGAACDRRPSSVKAEERLVDLRFEQKHLLDELYQRYGHGELAGAVKEKAAEGEQRADDARDKSGTDSEAKGDKGIAKELLRAVGNAALEVDRAAFDSHCTVAGGGERPSILSEKGKAFFAQAEVLETCKKVTKLEIQIDAQEAALARLRASEAEG